MSTTYYLTPPIPYDALLAALPEGITVKRDLTNVPEDPPGHKGPPNRLFVAGIPHVLLQDQCGNTLWMYRDEIDSAMFEKFGRQGSLTHFAEAIEAQGVEMTDEYGCDWTNDGYRCHSCTLRNA